MLAAMVCAGFGGGLTLMCLGNEGLRQRVGHNKQMDHTGLVFVKYEPQRVMDLMHFFLTFFSSFPILLEDNAFANLSLTAVDVRSCFLDSETIRSQLHHSLW